MKTSRVEKALRRASIEGLAVLRKTNIYMETSRETWYKQYGAVATCRRILNIFQLDLRSPARNCRVTRSIPANRGSGDMPDKESSDAVGRRRLTQDT